MRRGITSVIPYIVVKTTTEAEQGLLTKCLQFAILKMCLITKINMHKTNKK